MTTTATARGDARRASTTRRPSAAATRRGGSATTSASEPTPHVGSVSSNARRATSHDAASPSRRWWSGMGIELADSRRDAKPSEVSSTTSGATRNAEAHRSAASRAHVDASPAAVSPTAIAVAPRPIADNHAGSADVVSRPEQASPLPSRPFPTPFVALFVRICAVIFAEYARDASARARDGGAFCLGSRAALELRSRRRHLRGVLPAALRRRRGDGF